MRRIRRSAGGRSACLSTGPGFSGRRYGRCCGPQRGASFPVMLPFIADLSEFLAARALIDKEIEHAHSPRPRAAGQNPLGVMIEVPVDHLPARSTFCRSSTSFRSGATTSFSFFSPPTGKTIAWRGASICSILRRSGSCGMIAERRKRRHGFRPLRRNGWTPRRSHGLDRAWLPLDIYGAGFGWSGEGHGAVA